ncbi:delta-lactam-biosynthetic de-N-acetylase [Pseudogracilibacillus auburnensis]|uniref:Peptidoglycan-N-acetylmuramic acid deacetylase n=1 Tax=Pseudogracilibacillus auburnensis TaxID=1494959 RepID=A0A2V3VR01_9BACI|nr:delta-lactam-biosynthetic de-N-acetylase [Pseudogracilibacillus auburnensis]MBO1001470.1 delta-lactam-biosynthetic de-N-acetylase [Pseudogracilibacillus auburnensis]PXW82435.1 peptidoglycan-N-acetylmuramic acid deacetylase [Pseudogracilibacillus auburnensis]
MNTICKSFITYVLLLAVLFSSNDIVYGYGWGYQKNNDNKLPDVGKYGEMLKNHHAFYADMTNEKEIYLTFDNGYEQGYTEKVLNVLKKTGVHATFFVTGHYVEEEPELVKRMVNEGHIIGNHSYNHPDFTNMSKEAMKKELDMLEEAVAKVSAQKELTYLRPPRGTFNENTLKWADEFGYVHIFWSLAFRDWETNKQKGWKYAYDQIVNQVHPGAIVLLHTVSEDNAEALEKVIIQLKKEGYTFRSLDELMMKHTFAKDILF